MSRSVEVDPEVLLVDLHLPRELIEERDGIERGEAGLAPMLGVERRDPDQPVHPPFGRQEAVRKAPPDDEGGREEPGLLALGRLIDLDAEAAPLGPPRVHAQEHLGPVLRVGPAGTGMDLGHRIAVVVLAREQRLELEPGHPGLEIAECLLKLLGQFRFWRATRLGLGDQLVEHTRVVETRDQLLELGQVVGDPAELGRHRAAAVGVVPQIGLRGLGLKLVPAAT